MANKSNESENLRIGKLLKKAREYRKISQADMVETTGLSKNHISAIERGVSKPSIECLLGYCNKLNLTPNDILEYTSSNIMPEIHMELSSARIDQQKRILEIIRILLKNEQ